MQCTLCHHCAQDCQQDSDKTRNMLRLKYCACHEKGRWRVPKWCTCHLPWKMQLMLWKHRKGIAPATQNDCRHVTKHVYLSQRATPATRSETTSGLKPPKMRSCAPFPIGSECWQHSRHNYDDTWHIQGKHTSNPQTPTRNGNPSLRFPEKTIPHHQRTIPVVHGFFFSVTCRGRLERRICFTHPSLLPVAPSTVIQLTWFSGLPLATTMVPDGQRHSM